MPSGEPLPLPKRLSSVAPAKTRRPWMLALVTSAAGQLSSRATTVCMPPPGAGTAVYAFAVNLPAALPVSQFVDEDVSLETYLSTFRMHCCRVALVDSLTCLA